MKSFDAPWTAGTRLLLVDPLAVSVGLPTTTVGGELWSAAVARQPVLPRAVTAQAGIRIVSDARY
jgi:hypothetical protein